MTSGDGGEEWHRGHVRSEGWGGGWGSWEREMRQLSAAALASEQLLRSSEKGGLGGEWGGECELSQLTSAKIAAKILESISGERGGRGGSRGGREGEYTSLEEDGGRWGGARERCGGGERGGGEGMGEGLGVWATSPGRRDEIEFDFDRLAKASAAKEVLERISEKEGGRRLEERARREVLKSGLTQGKASSGEEGSGGKGARARGEGGEEGVSKWGDEDVHGGGFMERENGDAGTSSDDDDGGGRDVDEGEVLSKERDPGGKGDVPRMVLLLGTGHGSQAFLGTPSQSSTSLVCVKRLSANLSPHGKIALRGALKVLRRLPAHPCVLRYIGSAHSRSTRQLFLFCAYAEVLFFPHQCPHFSLLPLFCQCHLIHALLHF